MSAEPGITFDRERTPYSEAWELRRLRRELAEKNRLIATLTRQINSPVFLLRAALRNLIYLIPYVVRRLRDRRFEKELLRKVELIRNSRMFDEQWYLSRYPDVAEAGTDPIMHYIMSGAAEGRDPCPGFSTRAYLRNCLDVAAASANPLVHYIEHGRKEGRQAVGHEYQLWVERFDTLTDADRVVIKSAIDRFSMRPLISVLMPVYNTEPKWLTRAIESVRAQLYPNWELCISDNASTSSHVREILNAYAQIDERIRIFYRDTNGHISRNSNSALALATGEFVALMDSDDELAEHALFWVANEILCHPDVDLIYSDEDKIDVVGQRYDAYFKPD